MRNRIKELMRLQKLSRDDVAEAIGAHPVTVSKLISGKTPLNTNWLEKLSALFRVPPEQIIAAPPTVRAVQVKYSVQAGHWAETVEWAHDDWYDVAIPDDPDLRLYELFGAETRGPSMDKRYPEGTVVICTSMVETREDIQPGKRYIIERERADGMREATVKLLWRDDAGKFWLLPESNDPRFQQPIALDDIEDTTVRIVGRIRYSVQREE
ncbi:LexA family protein [Pelagibacterium limicola]|uniref:LexA family protein n=1 Tax=Pelagibacterium limicola TaxID=2791022 RepID=UPI0018B00D93|nr:LexA family transcriptional regulator [Pelagibacterium limicola]